LAEPAAEGEEMPENMEPVEAAPSDTAAATMDRGGETVKKTEVEGKAEELAAEPKPMEQRGKTREAQPRAEPPRDFSPMCGSSRVLCIEYPKDRLELVEHQLSALGMSVSRVDDLEQGFWACFTESPHILVIQAAGCSGKVAKLLHNLGTHPVTRTLPVLLIDEDQAVKEGLIPNEINLTVLQYPMDWEELLSELERHLPMFAAKEEERQPEGEAAAHEPAPHITPAADAVDAASFHAKNGTPTTVLCIDDDPVVIRSIAIRLQPYGIRVEGADNGTQGYLQAVAMRPDLILLDLKMPNGAGNYVLLKLKENDSTRNIPVIVLTVETHPGVRRNMVAVGAAGFLTKPVRWPELFAAMAQCIPLPTQLLKDYKLADSLLLSKP
jgi:CheY-like chemotaxis protein